MMDVTDYHFSNGLIDTKVELQRNHPLSKLLENDLHAKEYVERFLQMDHSIFGNLIHLNSDTKEESQCSQEEIYLDEQSSTCVPDSSVEEGYGSDFYPHTINTDLAAQQSDNGESQHRPTQISSNKKSPKHRNKKNLLNKGKELRFHCTQCDYRTWKKSNFQRHLGTHNKRVHKCILCSYAAKHLNDLKRHIIGHSKKEVDAPAASDRVLQIKKEIFKNGPEGKKNEVEAKRDSKAGPQLICPPVEVYLDEQSSSNSCIPESSVEDGYDSDTYSLAGQLGNSKIQELQKLGTIAQIKRVTQSSGNNALLKNKKLFKELRYSCPYCSYRTWKTSNYQRHLCTHTNDRPHKCHLCKYSGKHHEDLKKHMLCHNKELTIIVKNEILGNRASNFESSPNNSKRFSCLLCDFKTTRSSMLNRHQRVVHNDSRPYACDLCPYRSKQRDSLKKHMMAHTDERPFECDICQHRCRQKGDLKRHRLLHTGERPFACQHCPYRSNRTQLLKKHILRRHSIPQISSEITVTKTNLMYEEFTGSHYLAEML